MISEVENSSFKFSQNVTFDIRPQNKQLRCCQCVIAQPMPRSSLRLVSYSRIMDDFDLVSSCSPWCYVMFLICQLFSLRWNIVCIIIYWMGFILNNILMHLCVGVFFAHLKNSFANIYCSNFVRFELRSYFISIDISNLYFQIYHHVSSSVWLKISNLKEVKQSK